MLTREALHRLVDELPDDAIDAAGRSLVALRASPMARAVAIAPEDDEPLTRDEALLLDERSKSPGVASADEVRRALTR
jgi:hypothetical protein